jgi:hypothetical protein
MSDFEIIDSCNVEFVQRTRKPKYELSPWNYGNAEGEYQYTKLFSVHISVDTAI